MTKKFLVILLFLLILPFVSAVGDISISPTSEIITANVGEQVTKTITLANSNTTNFWLVTLPGTMNFVGTNHDLNNVPVVYNVSGSSVNIASSSSQTLEYRFTVPSDAYAETYNEILNFTTASADDYAELSLALTVNVNHNIAVNNITLDIAQGQTGTGTLTLTNNGNIDETAALPSTVNLVSTTNAANVITASIAKTSLDVDYKKTNSTTVTVNVPATAAKETYEGNIQITYGGTQTVNSLVKVNVVDPSYNINTGNIAFPLADPNSTVSTTFSVKNTGNAALTNLVFDLANVPSQYNLTLNQTTAFNLGIGETKRVTANVFIPYTESVGNHSIGSVSLTSNQKNFTSAYNVYMDVEAKLDIYDLDIFIDGDQESNVDNGERLDEKAEPGSEIELKIRIVNSFSTKSDIRINDITATVTIVDPDDDEVDEGEIDVGDLDADEKSDEDSIMFELPLDVQEGKYTIKIEVEGEDENGVRHSVDWNVYFDLEKKSHEIIIYQAYLTPETVKCARTSSLDVKLMNIGAKTEDEVRLTIANSDLGITVDKRDIELSKNPDDSDNTYTEEVRIDAKDLAAGSYPITVRAYYEETLLDDVKTPTLIVEDCPPAKKEEEKKDQTTVVVQKPEQDVTIPTTGEEIPTTTEASFMQSSAGIALLVLGNVAVLGIVIALVVKLFFAPKIPKP